MPAKMHTKQTTKVILKLNMIINKIDHLPTEECNNVLAQDDRAYIVKVRESVQRNAIVGCAVWAHMNTLWKKYKGSTKTKQINQQIENAVKNTDEKYLDEANDHDPYLANYQQNG